jgi:DNA replication ATP-dependent helicase Dna2
MPGTHLGGPKLIPDGGVGRVVVERPSHVPRFPPRQPNQATSDLGIPRAPQSHRDSTDSRRLSTFGKESDVLPIPSHSTHTPVSSVTLKRGAESVTTTHSSPKRISLARTAIARTVSNEDMGEIGWHLSPNKMINNSNYPEQYPLNDLNSVKNEIKGMMGTLDRVRSRNSFPSVSSMKRGGSGGDSPTFLSAWLAKNTPPPQSRSKHLTVEIEKPLSSSGASIQGNDHTDSASVNMSVFEEVEELLKSDDGGDKGTGCTGVMETLNFNATSTHDMIRKSEATPQVHSLVGSSTALEAPMLESKVKSVEGGDTFMVPRVVNGDEESSRAPGTCSKGLLVARKDDYSGGEFVTPVTKKSSSVWTCPYDSFMFSPFSDSAIKSVEVIEAAYALSQPQGGQQQHVLEKPSPPDNAIVTPIMSQSSATDAATPWTKLTVNALLQMESDATNRDHRDCGTGAANVPNPGIIIADSSGANSNCQGVAKVEIGESTGFINDGMDDFDDFDIDIEVLNNIDALAEVHLQNKNKSSANTHVTEDLYCALDQDRFTVVKVEDDPLCLQRTITVEPTRSNSMTRGSWEKENETCVIIIRGEWLACVVRPTMIVSIVWSANSTKESRKSKAPPGAAAIIDDSNHWLIVHPDILLSPSVVTNANPCVRRAVLSSILPSEGTTKSAVLGQMKHSLYGAFIVNPISFQLNATKEVEKIISEYIPKLYEVGVSQNSAKEHLFSSMNGIKAWRDQYASKEGVISFRGTDRNIKICQTLDIEENIWAPMWGLKGKLDMTAEVSSRSAALRGSVGATHESKSKLCSVDIHPIEFKSGKPQQSHEAQVLLYSMMIRERYGYKASSTDADDEAGVLVYFAEDGADRNTSMRSNTSSSFKVSGVPKKRLELRSLIIQRNELAQVLSTSLWSCSGSDVDSAESYSPLILPPLLQEDRSCTRCFQLEGCFLYHKALENGTADSSGIPDLWSSKLGHLTSTHLAYFKKWMRLVDIESADLLRFDKVAWAIPGPEREIKHRKCLSSLQLVEAKVGSQGRQEHVYTFQRHPASNARYQLSTQSLLAHVDFNSGDKVSISTENGHFGLVSSAVIRKISAEVIEIVTDTKIKVPHCVDLTVVVFRLDDTVYKTGLELAKQNLLSLFVGKAGAGASHAVYGTIAPSDNLGDVKRRSLIVDLAEPTFRDSTSFKFIGTQVKGCSQLDVEKQFNTLNEDQKAAVMKVFNAQDYCLLQGMPGTGKTSTLALIVRILLSQGKSVLVTAYTHSALDNLLLKIIESGVDVLRLGNTQEPKLKEYTVDALNTSGTLEGYSATLHSARLVGTTCLSIRHPLFAKRLFDYCIVDEAGQITEPIAIGPLRFADVFVLVGDHQQLPPIVKVPAAKQGGLDISLFERLAKHHPKSVVKLRCQYRMNKDVMLVANTLIYDGQLRCGNSMIANQMLNLPHWDRMSTCKDMAVPSWVREATDPSRPVVFLDVDGVRGSSLPAEDGRAPQFSNQVSLVEAEVISKVVSALKLCGLKMEEVGIISPYRAQLKVIKKNLYGNVYGSASQIYVEDQVEVQTVDKFQGRDKSCIIVSLVKSSDKGDVGTLLQDWRRHNVAFTRSKCKLIFVGSLSTLEVSGHFTKFVELFRSQSWVLPLPPAAIAFALDSDRRALGVQEVDHRGDKCEGSENHVVSANQVGSTKEQVKVEGNYGSDASQRQILKSL